MVVIEVDDFETRDSRETTPINIARNPDDGFETASDGDLAGSDDDEIRIRPIQQQEQELEQEQEQEQEQTVVSDDELREVSFSCFFFVFVFFSCINKSVSSKFVGVVLYLDNLLWGLRTDFVSGLNCLLSNGWCYIRWIASSNKCIEISKDYSLY